MTQKRKGQGKKSKIKGLSKRVLQPSGEQLSPPGQVSRAKSGENSLNNTNQDMIESAEDDGSERAESGPNVVVQNKQVVVSDEASTSLGSPERVADEQEQELELGLSQVASFLKDNSVLSPLAPVFQSNSNIGKQAASHVNVTRTARAWEKPTQTTNFEDNGAGVTSALDSKWAERFRELEELEINRREELNKQMREARLKLEKEMHQARIEHEMAMKKREIQRRRDELRKLEEEVFGNDIEHQLSDRESSSNAREPDKTQSSNLQPNRQKQFKSALGDTSYRKLCTPRKYNNQWNWMSNSAKLATRQFVAVTISIREAADYDGRSSEGIKNASKGIHEF
ncbi:uncharacterized protein LOC124435122 [Xenia sp. Carnegie-2017]|uniref:uncharacterized protein LOC124435122 n=1 Tax=Xenia sp. Carnegie-2017 TaxID=2897299 RepID=UPI001F034DC7|nr:uncharacterized protein LOC124435122 [Xenia sp. Carnegie-2017]